MPVLRRCLLVRGFEGPVLGVNSAFRDPLFQGGNLLHAERVLNTRRRHDVVGEVGRHALDERALVGSAGHNRGAIGLSSLEGSAALVEAKPALAVLLVRAVAIKAMFRQDGANVAVER